MKLRHTMILCNFLRLRMKVLETENNKLLGVYKSLLGKLKARYKLMKEAERKYREPLGYPEREGEKEVSTNIQKENIQVIFMLIFIIIGPLNPVFHQYGDRVASVIGFSVLCSLFSVCMLHFF